MGIFDPVPLYQPVHGSPRESDTMNSSMEVTLQLFKGGGESMEPINVGSHQTYQHWRGPVTQKRDHVSKEDLTGKISLWTKTFRVPNSSSAGLGGPLLGWHSHAF